MLTEITVPTKMAMKIHRIMLANQERLREELSLLNDCIAVNQCKDAFGNPIVFEETPRIRRVKGA